MRKYIIKKTIQKPEKITKAVSLDVDMVDFAIDYINDKDTQINSFSQYVNISLKEFNKIKLKEYEKR